MKRLCFLLLATWLLSLPARADGIPIVGSAFETPGVAGFFITSPTTAFSASAFANGTNVLGGPTDHPFTCSPTPCDLTIGIGAVDSPRFTWIDGTMPDCNSPGHGGGCLQGGLFFPNPGFLIALPPNTHFTLSGTSPFSGQLEGFSTFQGPQVFSVDLSGTANFTFTGQENSNGTAVLVDQAQFNFVGTATPVPEPSSLLLLGSGLVIFARCKRKRA